MINENKNKNENLINIIEKPEFNFDAYFELFPERRTKEHYTFLCWFVGYSEGHASIFTAKKSLHTTQTIFRLWSQQLSLLQYVQKTLDLGNIRQEPNRPYITYVYAVSDKENISKLMRIFNGNVRLNKTNKQIQIWHETSIKYDNPATKIVLLPQQNKLSLNNGWLSGFIDAEGSFVANLFKSKDSKSGFGLRLRCIFACQAEFEVLEMIRKICSSEGQILRLPFGINLFRLELQSKSSLEILEKYLEQYPLKTKDKQLSFMKWKELLKYGYQKNLFPIAQDEEKFLKLKKQIKEINEHSIRSPYYNKNLNKEK